MKTNLPEQTEALPRPGETPDGSLPYCESRMRTIRWKTREVKIGDVGVGGDNPVRVQSMTTTLTADVDATVRQAVELAEAGCEIVRITAPTTKDARCLADIRKKMNQAGVRVPLVADIHFAPKAAMEAVKHVEKVRINPGNYADRKKFAVREYTDNEYESELQRLYEDFSPIVLECLRRGKAMRIGTNHGSLSDRIMNRFGDSPEGMVQSALEFIRIAESHGFHDIILSMKASNPKVMIAAYRLAVARMRELDMNYPLHLGVTEAGDGEDGRVKSAIGIGSLLYDGIGDTIRVSLTEDPVREVPVGLDLARRAMALWNREAPAESDDAVNPYDYRRRPTRPVRIGPRLTLGAEQPPAVITETRLPLTQERDIIRDVCRVQSKFKDAQIEILSVAAESTDDLDRLPFLAEALHTVLPAIAVRPGPALTPADFTPARLPGAMQWLLYGHVSRESETETAAWGERAAELGCGWIAACALPEDVTLLADAPQAPALLTLVPRRDTMRHPLGDYRKLAQLASGADIDAPIWIQTADANSLIPEPHTSPRLLEASLLAGPLLCDGIGDAISANMFDDPAAATAISFNILQGTRTRITRTEYVACPSCGRTLFDLQSTTRQIREKTDHLKGVTIAVMGCIVNGPGEMADADFGYVGGAPGKINLYVGKQCVKVGIPQAEAVDRLTDLIREHGKWVEPGKD